MPDSLTQSDVEIRPLSDVMAAEVIGLDLRQPVPPDVMLSRRLRASYENVWSVVPPSSVILTFVRWFAESHRYSVSLVTFQRMKGG